MQYAEISKRSFSMDAFYALDFFGIIMDYVHTLYKDVDRITEMQIWDFFDKSQNVFQADYFVCII